MAKYNYLEGPIFDDPLRDFDMIINEALVTMIRNDAEEATVTLKIDITREGEAISLRHNANYNVPAKEKFEGKTAPGQFRLQLTSNGIEISDAMDQIKMEEVGRYA